jgi:predicted nuclease of predicted toxin-antitoxin system
VHFLIDAQLPPSLARFLTAAGHSAEHVADAGLLAAADTAICDHARSTNAIIVTKDADFAALTALNLEGCAGSRITMRAANSGATQLKPG